MAKRVIRIECRARPPAHRLAFVGRIAQAHDPIRKGSAIPRRDSDPTLVATQQSRDPSILVANHDGGPAGGKDSVNLARHDQALELRQEREPVNVGNTQALTELIPRLVGHEKYGVETVTRRLRLEHLTI